MKKTFTRATVIACAAISLGTLIPACATNQPTATAEQVSDGEALPPAPPVPATPASTSSPTAPTVPDSQVPTAPAPPAKEALSEAQIAKVSELVNTAEIDQGKLAQGKAKATNVKQFAAMMIKHHGEALREQAKLVKKLNLTPADSKTAATLKTDGDTTLDKLKKTDAASFDAAYITSQIEGHQKALDLLDTQLIPAAKTPEVTDALRRARAVVEEHLTQARALSK